MKKKYQVLSVFLLVIISCDFCEAQSTAWRRFPRREFMFGGGASNFLGDLGGANQIGTNGLKDLNWSAVRPCFIVGYRYRTGIASAVKCNLIYSILAGNDKFTKEPYRNNRNCNFRSPLIELNYQYEYTIIRQRTGHIYKFWGVQGLKNIDIQTFLFAGIGVMYFNPKGEWNNQWYALRPLCTEGEGLVPNRKKYSLIQPVIPVGIGFKYGISTDWSIGVEYGIRKTFTDYIDDVSTTYVDTTLLKQKFGGTKGELAAHFSNPTNKSLSNYKVVTTPGEERGDPSHKDSYMFATITFYYKIPSDKFSFAKIMSELSVNRLIRNFNKYKKQKQ